MAQVISSASTSTLGIGCNEFQASIATNLIECLARLENDRKLQVDALSIQGSQVGPEIDNPDHFDSINVIRVLEHFDEGVVVNATLISTGKGMMLDSTDGEILAVMREAVQLAESSVPGFSLGGGVRLGPDGTVEQVDIKDDEAFREDEER